MDDAASRADRRATQRDRARRRNRWLAVVAVGLVVVGGAVAAVLALGGGGGGGGGGSSSDAGGGATTVDLRVGDVASDSAGPAATFTQTQAQSVLAVIRAYVDRAIVAPLRTGEPGDLSAVFDAATLTRVAGADKPIMTEAGLPKVAGGLTVRGKPVALVALGDQSGTVVLVSAAVDLTVDGKVDGAKAPLHVTQTGELVLAPDGAGGWRVTAYSMAVKRSGGGVDATAPSTPTTTKAAK